jgi:hypothetical protein
MQPKTITLLVSIFTVIAAYTQNAFDHNDFQKNIKVTGVDGRPFVNPAEDVEGTQFFIEEWKIGSIKLFNNGVYNHVPVRMNLQSQQVHFLDENNVELAIFPDLVRELFIYDTINGETQVYEFECGFPVLEKQNEKSFYQVLSHGKIKLLKSIQKEIREEKNDLGSQIKKEFLTYEYYYIFSNNNLQQVRLNKNSILLSFSDQQMKIEDFVKSNKLSYKSANDFKKMVDYYNTL